MSLKVKEEKFKVIQFIRELIIYIDKNLENFPNVKWNAKIHKKWKIKMTRFYIKNLSIKYL